MHQAPEDQSNQDAATRVELITAEIARLDLKPGDTLVVKLRDRMSPLKEERIRRQLDGFMRLSHKGVKTLILPDGMDIAVIQDNAEQGGSNGQASR